MTTGELSTHTVLPPVCLTDVERLAATRLAPEVWDYIQGGSGGEHTLNANRAALDDIALVPRVLRGAAPSSTAAKLFNTQASMPLAIGPMAYHQLAHPDGELASAEAAKAAGVPFTVAMLSSRSLEDLARTGADLWFQLYWLRERGRMLDLLRRAEACGCQALVITVDVPIMARRLRDLRNAFALPNEIRAANLDSSPTSANRQEAGISAVAEYTRLAFDPAVGWRDLEWLRSHTTLPLVVKGIMDGSDAARAVGCGADGIVVSNHGGRQFDGAPASVTAVSEVRGAVGDHTEVLLDGGVRNGLDILRALALGASGVLLGRPVLWGLAMNGASGVAEVLSLLRAEFTEGLELLGCSDPGEAKRLRTVPRLHSALRLEAGMPRPRSPF